MLRRIESNWLRHYTTARKLEAAAANAVHRRHSPAIAFITSFCVDPNVDPTIVARGGPTRQHDTPGRVFFLTYSRTRKLIWEKPFVWLRFVDLSRTPSGTFFLEVHPGSEMACQNHQIVT